MIRSITLLASTAVLAASLSGAAFSQGAPQTVTLMKVDPASVATGYRTPTEKVPFAVLSVGGFLGMGTKYVVVPFSSLQVKDKHMVLPGATKDSLKALPDFKYNTNT